MTKPSMGRRPARNGDEQDVFTGWRRFYCYTQRPGVTSAVKRGARRRERHEARLSARGFRADFIILDEAQDLREADRG